MAATECTLTNSQVNSGTAVKLNQISYSYSWKNLAGAEPVPGKYDKTSADMRGWENPVITLSGAINVDDAASNTMTMDLLIDFAKERTATTTLLIYCGTTPFVLRDSDKGSSGLSVQVISFSLKGDTNTKDGHIIDYELEVQETA